MTDYIVLSLINDYHNIISIYFPNDIERERFIFNAEIDRLSRRPL
jgi:hypothetical protein